MQKPAQAATATSKIIPVRIIRKPMGKKRRWIAIGIGLIIALAIIGGITYKFLNSSGAKIETDKYQVVFAGNNQAWFGKLHILSDGGYQLTNVFYYSGQTNTSTAQKPNAEAQTPQLTKMGSELHGPTDQIIFPKDQVVFWENLRGDSKVSQAIDSYSKK